MLRTVLVVAGVVGTLCGLVLFATGQFPPAALLGIWGAVIVLGVLFERVIYKPINRSHPGPGWERTGERFVDHTTGAPVTVYFEPKSGERTYVRE